MITGVTYFIPFEKRFQVIKQLFPNIKSVGLLLQKGHPAAPIDQQGTNAQCSPEWDRISGSCGQNLNQLVDGTKQLSGKADVFILSSTALVLDNLMSLLAITNPSKTPIFSYAADRAERAPPLSWRPTTKSLGECWRSR